MYFLVKNMGSGAKSQAAWVWILLWVLSDLVQISHFLSIFSTTKCEY